MISLQEQLVKSLLTLNFPSLPYQEYNKEYLSMSLC